MKDMRMKMIRLNQLKLPVDHTREQLIHKTAQYLRIPAADILELQIVRQSLDARKKPALFYRYSVNVTVKKEEKVYKDACRRLGKANVLLTEKTEYLFPAEGSTQQKHPTVIIGMGPAGLFCGYYLAQHGYAPVILERGADVDARQADVEAFWQTGRLKQDSNVQFGEGGAGTFSDGKLNTLVKDPSGRNHEVLKRFVQAGAPSEIIYQQKPHLGTDVLVGVVETLRHEIEEMGGKFQFRSKVTDLFFENSQLKEIEINGEKRIPAQVCVLAVGHSARDSFFMFEKKGIYMEPKSFAVGVRMEHPQSMINLALYGEEENEKLGAAAYKVTHTCENGRGVYSFCMCPGGYVVNASSEPEMLAVNGMSYQARDSRNANSALIVSVTPADFPEEGPLGGVAFQRNLERAAWKAGNGNVPVQLFEDYQKHKPSTRLKDVEPCIKGACVPGDVRSIFPKEIGDSIEEGVLAFGKKIKGFDRPDAVLSGVESRTSSPVRIVRDKDSLEANYGGIYPCGEGAGYAGGITSAAMDGIKVAEAVSKKFRNF